MPATGTAGVVDDRLTPTPGQLGAAAGPHGPGVANVVDPRNVQPPPAEPTQVLANPRAFRLGPGGTSTGLRSYYAPYAEPGADPAWTAQAQYTGAPGLAAATIEHGPARFVTPGWWPFKRKRDTRGVWPEKVIPATGGRFEVAEPSPTYAALAAENQFVIPDRRRIPAPAGDAVLSDGRAGHSMTPTTLEPTPYHIYSHPSDADDVNMEDVTVRPRAGAQDPRLARPSSVPRWLYQRPFDQWAAEHPPGLKGVSGPPRVGLPISTRAEVAVTPQSGFHVVTPAPGMSPVGLQPNTWRVTPQSWDQDLVNTGSSPEPMVSGAQGIAAASRVAARGFGLR